MITFWLVVIGLILLGLVFVLLPLLSKKNKHTYISREEVNKAIYAGKVEDLDADLERNLLDKEEYDHALADLQQTLLQDANVESEEVKPERSGNNMVITLVLALCMPVAALLIYQQVSTGGYTNDISQQQASSTQVQSIENSIAVLEQKLKEKPDNVEGWTMLGQSYFVIQRYADAKAAYLKALDLANQADPEILVFTAEASAFSNSEIFGDYEKSLLAKALSINPNHERALWYAGYAAYTTSEFPVAVGHWQKLLTLVPTERPEVKTSLTQFLNSARDKAGLEPLEDSAQVAQDTSDQRKIEVSVQLNESVNQNASSGDTLFIYARAVDGPKMPLSLARLTVANLPAKVTLSKEMAMMPSMDIDTFEKVEVIARISKSGQAITQKGDLISAPVVVEFTQSNTATVTLDINAVAK